MNENLDTNNQNLNIETFKKDVTIEEKPNENKNIGLKEKLANKFKSAGRLLKLFGKTQENKLDFQDNSEKNDEIKNESEDFQRKSQLELKNFYFLLFKLIVSILKIMIKKVQL